MREFIIWTANALGIDIEFKGSGVKEVAVVTGVNGDMAPKTIWGENYQNWIHGTLGLPKLKLS